MVERVKIKRGTARMGVDNPLRRPKGYQKLREMMRPKTQAMLRRLEALTRSPDGKVAVTALKVWFDHAYGRPAMALKLDIPEGAVFGVMRLKEPPKDGDEWSRQAQEHYRAGLIEQKKLH